VDKKAIRFNNGQLALNAYSSSK